MHIQYKRLDEGTTGDVFGVALYGRDDDGPLFEQINSSIMSI